MENTNQGYTNQDHRGFANGTGKIIPMKDQTFIVEIEQALARGYTSPENEKKVLDAELIKAMAIEVDKLVLGKIIEN